MVSLNKYFIENENIGLYEQIFENVAIIDSHAHIGVDKDGQRLRVPEILKQMKNNDIDRAIIFPLDDPKAGPDFHYPNERILRAFNEHPTRFVPFFRLNPNKKWEKELARRVEQGFKGIKLHPRSQNFNITSPEAMKLYERIEKENLLVLIHAGFGVDYVAEEFLEISKSFPKIKLIVGHGGFPDIDNVIRLLKERDNVVFETSTMRIFDLIELMKNIPYRRIVFGSDTPIYDPTLALQMLVDSASMAKQTPNQIRSMLGENIQKWLK